MNSTERPPALVAMSTAGPMGVLGYKIHVLQSTGSDALWINVLYVAHAFRRRGVGSQLVRAAVKAVTYSNRQSLFVYTDIPTFYESLGWRRISFNTETEMHVLEYRIRPGAATPGLIENP